MTILLYALNECCLLRVYIFLIITYFIQTQLILNLTKTALIINVANYRHKVPSIVESYDNCSLRKASAAARSGRSAGRAGAADGRIDRIPRLHAHHPVCARRLYHTIAIIMGTMGRCN